MLCLISCSLDLQIILEFKSRLRIPEFSCFHCKLLYLQDDCINDFGVYVRLNFKWNWYQLFKNTQFIPIFGIIRIVIVPFSQQINFLVNFWKTIKNPRKRNRFFIFKYLNHWNLMVYTFDISNFDIFQNL